MIPLNFFLNLIFLPIRTRRKLILLLEKFDKIIGIVNADTLADFLNFLMGRNEKSGRIFESDVSEIFNDAGWEARITLEKTIADTLDYWRDKV